MSLAEVWGQNLLYQTKGPHRALKVRDTQLGTTHFKKKNLFIFKHLQNNKFSLGMGRSHMINYIST